LDGVVLQSLSKTFGAGRNEKRAVRDLSVGMARGQCFGLLGINGAGKTSTFRMITGEFAPTRGDTRVLAPEGDAKGYVSVHDELSRARRAMGYCPQFDGLQPNMTGREHLQFYAQIRGVPTRDIDGVVNRLVRKMSLEKYADRAAGTYSGGNKRKLSVAVALVGEPSVVLLDEPTTGMDPEARRFTWDVISASTRGRTVVLTSHSMEECEALCNRIGIMVGGAFSCLGSVQHLKNRFSEGYSVELRFQAGRGSAVYEAIAAENLPGMEVVEAHQTELKLRVQDPSAKLGAIFAAVEKLRTAPAPPDARVVEMDRNDEVPGVTKERRGPGCASRWTTGTGTRAPRENAVGVTLVDDYSGLADDARAGVRAVRREAETGAGPRAGDGRRGRRAVPRRRRGGVRGDNGRRAGPAQARARVLRVRVLLRMLLPMIEDVFYLRSLS
jgi:ABC-type multidrug transport system ATPase subunit